MNVKKDFLGEFEELVLTMVMMLRSEAYGNAIVSAIRKELGRSSNLSAVHVTLYRLEDKGLLKSHFGESTAERGGRRKRIFLITNKGITKLRQLRDQRIHLWSQIPEFKI